MREAHILFDRIAPTITYPDLDYDWSANTIDETFVDSWALARIQNELSRDEQKLLKEAQAKSSSSLQGNKEQDQLFAKLISFGISQVLVQIKAVDGRHGIALTEYTDVDNTTVHWIWLPVSQLSPLQRPVPPKAIGFQPETLKKQFDISVKQSTVAFARQTLIQFFESTHSSNSKQESPDLSKDLKLHDIISWGVWNKFGD